MIQKAFNAQMWKEIGNLFHLLGSGIYNNNCRCIILRGEGKSFCGGIDLSDPAFGTETMNHEDDDNNDNNDEYPDPDQNPDVARKYLSFRPQILQMQESFSSLETKCPYPIISAIHGACIGAGVDLICSSDIRICTPNSKFGVREARLGLAADVGTLQRLPKIIGHGSRVRELCLTGEDFHAKEAERIGLVSRITRTNDSLMREAMDIATRIVSNSPVALVGTKMSMVYSRDHTVQDGLQHIATHNAAALMTDDLGLSIMGPSKSLKTFPNLLSHARL